MKFWNKRKKTGALLALVLVLACCSACQVRNVTKGMDEGEHYDAVISVKKQDSAAADQNSAAGDDAVAAMAGQALSAEDRSVLESILSMPGMTDAECAGVFDGGTENRTADGDYLIGRDYTVSLFGEDCALYISYGQAEAVDLAYVILPEGDVEAYAEKLSLLFGEAESYVGEDGEAAEWTWIKDGRMICLYQDESVILDFGLVSE